MSIATDLQTIAENTPKVYEAGKKAAYDAFWDSVQNNGNPAIYNSAFVGVTWNKDRFKPKYKIVPNTTTNSARAMFSCFDYTNYVQELMFNLTYDMVDLSNCTQQSQVANMFENAHMNSIEIDLSTIPRLQNIFNCNSGGMIYHIRTKINAEFFSTVFNYNNWLETLILEEGSVIGGNGFNVQWSTKLSKESIESIIAALSDSTTGLSITLSKTAVNNAFGINVDDPTTYPEGSEYYTLRNSRSNWTFNYA